MYNMLKQISHSVNAQVDDKTGRSLHFTGASCLGNLIVGMGKLILGIYSLSLFTCASAFYTFGMLTAKSVILVGIVKEEKLQKQYWYYRTAGLLLTLSSVLYIIYSIRLFVNPINSRYSMNVALLIATFTFTELGLNMRGVVVKRESRMLLIHGIKMINLASSLICLVLTQAAILSFADLQTETHPKANGLMGILMGCIAVLLGMIMIIRSRKGSNGQISKL